MPGQGADWSWVGAFQHCLGVLQPGLGVFEALRRDASGIGVNGQIGTGDDFVGSGALDQSSSGKAGGGHEIQFLAQRHGAAGFDDLTFQFQFRHDVDQVAGYRGRQLAEVGDFAFRQERQQGLFVGCGGRLERQRDFAVVDLGERQTDGSDQVAHDVFAEGPANRLLQLAGQFVVTAAGHLDGVRQSRRQHRVFFDDGFAAADDVAHRRIRHLVLDVVLQFLLSLGLGVLQDGRIEARRPAFGFVDGAAGDEALRQLFGIDAADTDRAQASQIVVWLVTGIENNLAVGVFILGSPARDVVDGRFYPYVFQTNPIDLAAADNGAFVVSLLFLLLDKAQLNALSILKFVAFNG